MRVARNLLWICPVLFLLAIGIHQRVVEVNYGSQENKTYILRTLERKQHHLRNPGFEKQLLEEKTNGSGQIPFGLIHQWDAHDRMREGSFLNSPLSNITELGPASVGGRTRAIHIDPINPDRVLAGGISGGIWVSSDRGVNWTVLDDKAANLSVSSIAYNPLNPNIIYYSTGEARGGGGIGGGIFKSTDNGQTFELLPSSLDHHEFNYTWKIAHSLTDSNTIFVASYRGLFRSTDAGASWIKVLNVDGKDANDILTFDDGSVMVAMEESGIYTSPTGDPNSFTNVNAPSFPENYSRIKLAYCATQQRFVYAMFAVDITSTIAPKIYRSIDQGQSWERKATPVTSGTQRRYNMMLGVHPTNPSKVVCGTVLSNYSENGGTTWFFTGVSHSDYHEYAYFPDNHNQFLVGNDGGIYLHRWNDIFVIQDRNRGYNVTQFYGGSYHPEAITTIGGTQDNGTIRVKAGGQFSYIFGADGGYAHVDQQDENTAYFSTQLDGLFRTDFWNEGIPVPTSIMYPPMGNEGVSFINAYEMNYADGRQLYYKTQKGVWRTSNRGNTWQRIGLDTISAIRRLSLSEETDPYLYFAGMNDENEMLLYRNTDALNGDEIETFLNTGEFDELYDASTVKIDVHPHNNDRILFSFYNYTGGADQCWMVANTWSPDTSVINLTGDLPENLPVNAMKFHPYNPDSIFFAATDFGLYYTLDAGQTWLKETNIPNVQIFDMRIRPSDNKMFLYTYGRGIWSADLLPQPTIPGNLPFVEDFATGTWSRACYADRSNNNGRVKITPRDSVPLFYFLSMDMSIDNGETGTAEFTLEVDPGDAEVLSISYFYYLYGEAIESEASGVYITSAGEGIEQRWRSFSELTTLPFSLDNILYPVTDTGIISIRFEFTGKKEIPDGGVSIAQITVQEVELPTAVNLNLSDRIRIFPNPASSVIYLEQLNDYPIQRVELFDIRGGMLHSWRISEQNTKALDIPPGLSSGNYLLAFYSDGQMIGSKQVVLNP